MKVKHVFGGHIYLISSYGVARNPIFKDEDDVHFFAKNIEKYLSEICEIYAYTHQINQFHYLVKIKERNILEEFFLQKQAEKRKNEAHNIYDLESEKIPDSYLIFSQEMSNCLNSYVKHYNFKHGRRGGLFADRYSKYLIESEEEMWEWIDRLNSMEELVIFREEWKVSDVFNLFREKVIFCSHAYFNSRARIGAKVLFRNFRRVGKVDLRGCFKSLPPYSVKAQNFSEKLNTYIKIHGVFPPW